MKPTKNTVQKPIKPVAQCLKYSWLAWLVYRLLVMPSLIGLLHINHPDILAGMFWQALWLVPAFVLTFWIVQGKSAYALLISSILTLIYLGASGVLILIRGFESGFGLLWVYIIDFLLLLSINVSLFLLLKRLPSMNKSVDKV